MTWSSFRKRFIGDKAFYRMVLAVAVPMMIQNGITNFVSLLDNIMVGRVGTEPMSGVAIVNQLLFVYNLCIFGGLSGAGIFTAQYYGSGDTEGIRITFRYKLWLGILLTIAAYALLLLRGDQLISLYLNASEEGGDLAATLYWGREYLKVMLLGLPPFMFVQVYASTLRECGETMLPMKAGIVAVTVNLVFNWLLIYGHFGFPKLGVPGAALATVLSRYVEAAIVLCWTHLHTNINKWVRGLYSTMRIPAENVRQIFLKGTPLLINEGLWSAGQAMLSQSYSIRGLNVVAAQNIASTINNLFFVVFMTLGSSISIIVGQRLGAGRMEEARDTDNKMIAFSIACSVMMGTLLLLTAPLFPQIYKTSDQVRVLAAQIMRVMALFMPLHAFMNATYFTLRSGGKTIITFIFDSVSVWVVSVPIAFVLSRYTDLWIVWIIAAVQLGDAAKCALGYYLVKKGVWINNIVTKSSAA